ncbi:hypothetical protein GCM10010468_32850 [Actinocorallia longicatena]|uniref:Large ribosomal subunit protein bL34 n=1 Tax=Actinocorallia longicatena TaxID=111803 RepID=A0ABP6QAB6_9ACTN
MVVTRARLLVQEGGPPLRGTKRARDATYLHQSSNERSQEHLVSKRTFQPNNRRRHKKHGFRLRMRTRAGQAILAARRRKGRASIAV